MTTRRRYQPPQESRRFGKSPKPNTNIKKAFFILAGLTIATIVIGKLLGFGAGPAPVSIDNNYTIDNIDQVLLMPKNITPAGIRDETILIELFWNGSKHDGQIIKTAIQFNAMNSRDDIAASEAELRQHLSSYAADNVSFVLCEGFVNNASELWLLRPTLQGVITKHFIRLTDDSLGKFSSKSGLMGFVCLK